MMKILLVDLSKRFGGADIRVIQTASALSGCCDVVVAVLEGSPVEKMLRDAGLKTHAISRSRHDPRMASELAEFARSFKPDLVDAHNPQSQLWGLVAAGLAGVPGRLATVHTVYREAHRGVFRQRSHEMTLRLARRLGAEFLTVSRSISEYVASLGVNRAHIHLSYNGMERLEGPIAPAGLRATLRLPSDALLFGMIGRVERVKGHDILVEALEELQRRGRTFHVAVVGEGRDEAELRRLISEKGLTGQVHMLGFRSDIPQILADIDIFCAPSRSEGLPYTVLEATRQGVPVIAAAVDGLAEVLEHDKTAILIPPESPGRLVEAIERIADDKALRLRLGNDGRAMFLERFLIPRMVEETLAVYRSVAGRAGRA